MQESNRIANGENEKISITQLILAFRKRWKLFVITSGMLVFISLTLAFGTANISFLRKILPDIFLSQGTFHVYSASEQTLLQSIKDLGYIQDFQDLPPSAASSNLGNYLVALTKTFTFQDSLSAEISAEDHYDLKKEKKGRARIIIGSMLKTSFDGNTGLLYITYEDSDPEFAKKTVEAAMDLLKSTYSAILENSVEQKRAILEEKIQLANRNALEIHDKLKKTGKNRITDMSIRDNFVLDEWFAGYTRALILKDLERQNAIALKVGSPEILEGIDAERKTIISKILNLMPTSGTMPDQISAEDMDHLRLLKESSVNMIILDTLIAEGAALAIKKNSITDILAVVERPNASDTPIAPARRQLALNWTVMSVLVAMLAVILAEFGARLLANLKAKI